MRVAITGSSGLIGRALCAALATDGHEVVRFVRRPATAPDEVEWDPRVSVDIDALGDIDAAVNLAGAGTGDRRWSTAYKQEIRDSRVLGTATLTRALLATAHPPRVLINGSAIGFYGDTRDMAVNESAPKGTGFLADVCEEWEAATAPAVDAGIRVVLARTGLVVSGSGGAWGRMNPLFKAGIGGRLGSGQQYWSFISLRDQVAALLFSLGHEQLSGPVNFTAPEPATNAEITKSMGTLLGRPTVLPVPGFALKAVIGEFSDEVLRSARVLPSKLLGAGFIFQDPSFAAAFAQAIKR